eukprot:15445523-Alexandrium_andersonii.AAC.1
MAPSPPVPCPPSSKAWIACSVSRGLPRRPPAWVLPGWSSTCSTGPSAEALLPWLPPLGRGAPSLGRRVPFGLSSAGGR